MIHRGPAVEIPDIPLVPFVLHRASELADKPALIDGLSGRQLTYGALADGVKRVASALRHRGFRKGDVFAIFSPNLIEYPIAFFAVASLGGVVTTINSLYTPRELADQLKNSDARFLLTVPSFMDRAGEAVKDTAIEEIFVFGNAPGATPFSELSLHPLMNSPSTSTRRRTWWRCPTRAAPPAWRKA
jgi:acyl-CoA synthetase (AMP-forming)/AMP-acid ligase II